MTCNSTKPEIASDSENGTTEAEKTILKKNPFYDDVLVEKASLPLFHHQQQQQSLSAETYFLNICSN